MAKGGNFELKVAKKLSLWFSDGKNDGLICRTDSSGGRATVRSKAKKQTSKYLFGDLKHSDEIARPLFDLWSIECKTGYAKKGKKWKDGATSRVTGWCVLDIIDSSQKEPVFLQFWDQCKRDAELSNREPVLIFGRNLKSPCIMFTVDYFDLMAADTLGDINHIIVCLENGDRLVILSLDKFFKSFSRHRFLRTRDEL